MGVGGIRVRIPPVLSNIGSKKGARGARENADCLFEEERRVHHYIVKKMARVQDPIPPAVIADDLGMSQGRVIEIVDKLERLKTFIYRSDGKAINWAYPLSLENTGFRMTASSGEQFFAA